MQKQYLLLLLTLSLFACNKTTRLAQSDLPNTQNTGITQTGNASPVKNIILLVGDGMGLTQVSTAYYFGDKEPVFSKFKHIGLHKNQPVGAKITDSAAGATAFSAGVKTYNGAIGVDKDTIAKETILEWAHKNKKSTGLISTSSITHATPASFFAHVKYRKMEEEIAADFMKTPIDFTAGGGYKFFNQRKDGQDLLQTLAKGGVVVDTTNLGTNPIFGKRYAYLLAPNAMPTMKDGRGDFLPRATATAIDYLQQDEDGFFLLVEGSQIDWGGHANDSEYIVTEVLDFNDAIEAAIDFADKDGNTLVVVTADHETGGYSLSSAEVFGKRDYKQIEATFSTGGHSAALIPVFAYGKGAAEFMGVYQNNDIFTKMMRLFQTVK